MNAVFTCKGAVIGEANAELKVRLIINKLVIRVTIIVFRRDSSGLV